MVSLLVALVIAAQPVGPLASNQSRLAIKIENPRKNLPSLRKFLSNVGTYAPVLKPETWGRSFGDLLGADLLDINSSEQAGINVDASVTISMERQAIVTCFSTVSKSKALRRIRDSLAGMGQVGRQKYQGVDMEGAAVNSGWRAGAAIKDRVICIASGGRDVLPVLRKLAAAMNGTGLAESKDYREQAKGFQGPISGYFCGGEMRGAFELEALSSGLRVRGRISGHRFYLDKPRENDLLFKFNPSTAMFASMVFSPRAWSDSTSPLANAIQFVVAQSCKECGEEVGGKLLASLQSASAGSLGFLATGVNTKAAGRSYESYFLITHAYLLPLKDRKKGAIALKQVVERIKVHGAQASPISGLGNGLHYSIGVGVRRVWVGIENSVLYLANEQGARDLALAEINKAKKAKPGKADHALRYAIDGLLATKALRRISLLDVPKSRELAALFAVGVEAGPLLRAIGPIRGYGEPDGGGAIRFELNLTAPKERE